MFTPLRERIQYFWNHQFVQRTVTLQAGTMIGNVIQALIGVLLARLLQPGRYGVYALAMGLASLLSIMLASGSQDAAASLLAASYAKGDKDETQTILAFYFKLTGYLIALSIVGIIFAPIITGYWYHDPAIGRYAAIVAAAAILSSTLFSGVTMMLQVVGEIPAMMGLSVADQVLRWMLSLLLVWFGYGIQGAVLGQFLGAAIVLLISAWLWRRIRRHHVIMPSLRELVQIFGRVPVRKYLGFSLWIAADRNLGTLYMVLPVLLAGIYVTAHEVAYFKLAFGYLNLGLSALGPISILLNMEFPKMRVENRSQLARNFVKVSGYSILLSAAITGVMVLIAPVIFRVLYGTSYLPSVPYVAGLFAYGALFGIGVGLGPMWRAINRVKTSILINVIILAIGIPGGAMLIKQFGLWGAVAAVTLWFTVSHFISFVYLSRFLKKRTYETV